jgi:predicted nucleic acid-binding protein
MILLPGRPSRLNQGRCRNRDEIEVAGSGYQSLPNIGDDLWRPRLRDADDDMVLEAAANGRADAIATFNTRDFAGVASEFGIAVLTPAEILRRL